MLEQVKFGTTKEGAEASIYILENSNGMHVQVSDFGAHILTIHTYFNLNGQNSGDILQHQLEIYSDSFLEIDEEFIPTGKILSVENTPMDFRRKNIIGKQIDYSDIQISRARGYDHNYVFVNDGKLKKMAKLHSEESGITMIVYSDLCGMQLYSGNFLNGIIGKDGTRYEEKAGICFETQYYPNACNEKRFPSSILKAGQLYKSRTVYEFKIQRLGKGEGL